MRKRSASAENAQGQLDLGPWPDGVGARQAAPSPSIPGGGYLDICNRRKVEKKRGRAVIEPRRDPRIDELRRVGLQRVWVEVAEAIGVDNWMVAWRIIDANPAASLEGNMLRVPLKNYRTWLRYQRNGYIRGLRARGLSTREIRALLAKQMGEAISEKHISRIAPGR